MRRIDFVFFDAGGGHRAAATALQLAIQQSGRPWDVRLVNLQEVLDRIDIFRQITRIRMQDVYNLLLRKGWTLGSEYMVPPMHLIIRLFHSKMRRMLTEYWKNDPPDLLVSVVPNFNRVLFESYRRAKPNGPMVTILTDIADYPPHFWIERQDQFFICGSDKAVQQAREAGHPSSRIFQVSGMILHPKFYQPVEFDRRTLGLLPNLPTGLVLFGGYGSAKMEVIARRIMEANAEIQLIFICGKNARLKERLAKLSLPYPHYIEGFTSEIPRYMAAADFFVGKPGPGSISEALQMKLPVIVERNAWTLPQERYNADWVLEKDIGVVLKDFDNIGEVIRDLPLARLRENAAKIHNRAVFEIPNILEKLLP